MENFHLSARLVNPWKGIFLLREYFHSILAVRGFADAE
jgi:hypothetical protein